MAVRSKQSSLAAQPGEKEWQAAGTNPAFGVKDLNRLYVFPMPLQCPTRPSTRVCGQSYQWHWRYDNEPGG